MNLSKNLFPFIFLALALCFFKTAGAQQKGKDELFHGRVTDPSGEPIAGAYIKNMNNAEVAITDSLGDFHIEMRAEDSLLIVALGREISKFKPGTKSFETIVMQMLTYQLKTVNIYDFKDWEHFKKEFVKKDIPGEKVNTKGLPSYQSKAPPIYVRSDVFPSKPNLAQKIISPFGTLHYYFSGIEKEKRKTWGLMKADEAEAMYRSIVNYDSIPKIVNIPEEKVGAFIVYCNREIEDKTRNDGFYYRGLILSLYKSFKEER